MFIMKSVRITSDPGRASAVGIMPRSRAGEAFNGTGGRLRPLSRFLGEWLEDLRGCGTTARRLFLRHLAQQYRFSSLGLLWAFAPSAITAVVLIGGQRAHILRKGEAVPAAFYGVFGLAMAQTFLEALNATRRIFASHQQLLRRQNVPLEGIIVAGFIDTAFSLLVRLAVLAVVFFAFSVPLVPATVAIAAIGFVGIALVGGGLGLLLAPLSSLKRDVDNLFGILPWMLFAVTPVFVPAPATGYLSWIYWLNPLARMFDGIRVAAYGGVGDPFAAFRGAVMGIVVMIIGWVFCRIARPHVVERMLG